MLVQDAAVDSLLGTYERALAEPRLQFADKLIALLTEQDPKRLLLFWINFSSFGVGMTEFVESWIQRAGQRCKELGYDVLGEQLRKHAIHEADHHLMMIEDTKRLVNLWNSRFVPVLHANEMLKRPYPDAVLQYGELHENCIASAEPFCQIAIEYEIENLSITCGPQILKHTFNVLGDDIKASLSFVQDHILIDAAHTMFNRKAISNFLNDHEETLPFLIDAGKRALNVYSNFVSTCYQHC